LTFKSGIGPDGVRVTFSEKPPDAIRSILKANGFRWSPVGGLWWRRAVKGAADFLGALDRAVGPRRPEGACWACGAPEGYFRPHGAATPVYCDACHAKRQEQPDPMGVDRAYEDACRDACGL
jgi:hypothetical protein